MSSSTTRSLSSLGRRTLDMILGPGSLAPTLSWLSAIISSSHFGDLLVTDVGSFSRVPVSFRRSRSVLLPRVLGSGIWHTSQSTMPSAVAISAAEPAGNSATCPSHDSPVGVNRPGARTLPPGNRDEHPNSRRVITFFEPSILHIVSTMEKKPGDSPANHPTRL